MSKKPTVSKPLLGVRILVGRARHQASALATELRKLGADVIEIPFIDIRRPRSFKALDDALKNLSGYEWLILTSVNGVEAMCKRMKKLHLTKATLRGLRIAAIGPATKKSIEEHGWTVDVVPKQYVAESVVRSLKMKIKEKRVLLVRARVARDVIPRELRKAGASVDVVEAYETVVPQGSRRSLQAVLRNTLRRPHVITFTSSSTVRNFVELAGLQKNMRHRALDEIRMASIGPVTSATLREFGLKPDIAAKEFTIPGLVAGIIRSFS